MEVWRGFLARLQQAIAYNWFFLRLFIVKLFLVLHKLNGEPTAWLSFYFFLFIEVLDNFFTRLRLHDVEVFHARVRPERIRVSNGSLRVFRLFHFSNVLDRFSLWFLLVLFLLFFDEVAVFVEYSDHQVSVGQRWLDPMVDSHHHTAYKLMSDSLLRSVRHFILRFNLLGVTRGSLTTILGHYNFEPSDLPALWLPEFFI